MAEDAAMRMSPRNGPSNGPSNGLPTDFIRVGIRFEARSMEMQWLSLKDPSPAVNATANVRHSELGSDLVLEPALQGAERTSGGLLLEAAEGWEFSGAGRRSRRLHPGTRLGYTNRQAKNPSETLFGVRT